MTNKIQTIIDNFIADITAAVREEALDAISEAFSKPVAKPPTKKLGGARVGSGRRPDPSSNAGRVREFLSFQPWASFADIRIALGLTTAQTARILANGLKTGTVQKRGKHRSHRYALAVRALEAA